jgi:hypothetical protein
MLSNRILAVAKTGFRIPIQTLFETTISEALLELHLQRNQQDLDVRSRTPTETQNLTNTNNFHRSLVTQNFVLIALSKQNGAAHSVSSSFAQHVMSNTGKLSVLIVIHAETVTCIGVINVIAATAAV